MVNVLKRALTVVETVLFGAAFVGQFIMGVVFISVIVYIVLNR